MTVRSLGSPVRRLARPRHSEAFRELGIFALAYVVYFGVRALTEGTAAAAMQHALDLIRFERQVGLDWERTIQDGIVGSRLLVDVANSVYMYGHWPVIIVTGVLLFRHRRPHYYRLRNACLLSGMVGLAIFALYPVAPPRLTDLPLVDTVTQNADGYRQLVPPPAWSTSTRLSRASTPAGTSCWASSSSGRRRTGSCAVWRSLGRLRWSSPSWQPPTTT